MGKEMICKAEDKLRMAMIRKSNELFSEGIARKSKAAALNG